MCFTTLHIPSQETRSYVYNAVRRPFGLEYNFLPYILYYVLCTHPMRAGCTSQFIVTVHTENGKPIENEYCSIGGVDHVSTNHNLHLWSRVHCKII